jgi:hypothetical protein
LCFDRRRDESAHFRENRPVRRLTDQMQRRLMLGRNSSRHNDCRYRLDALVFASINRPMHKRPGRRLRPTAVIKASTCSTKRRCSIASK